jgi:hypothetical protein
MSGRRATGVLAIAMALALAACGGNDDAGDPGPTAPATDAERSGGEDRAQPADGLVSVGDAEREIANALPDLPVWLPAPLPAGTQVESLDIHREDGRRYAQVQLDMGDRGPLQLQYGEAGFDGCPSEIRSASVAGQDALIARATPPGKLTTVIWPVKDASDPASRGIYGLGAELPPGRVLDLAVSMSRYTIPAPKGSSAGC